MSDYLQIYERFKDANEVRDYIDDVNTLRFYYGTQQFSLMQEHIHKLTLRYPVEACVWNAVNRNMPQTFEQAYINAENFLQVQGATIITRTVKNYSQHLSREESAYIEALIKPLG